MFCNEVLISTFIKIQSLKELKEVKRKRIFIGWILSNLMVSMYKCSVIRIMKHVLKQFLTFNLIRVKMVKNNEIFNGGNFMKLSVNALPVAYPESFYGGQVFSKYTQGD